MKKDYLNFAVGPVMMDKKVLETGSEQIPYFRTKEFSALMKENEDMLLKIANASYGSKAVFLTTSGTGGMEAAVINSFNQNDKILIVNGGSFGARFVEICQIHHLNYTEIKRERGQNITDIDLMPYDNKGYTGFLVNIHETSTGVLYNKDVIATYCKRNNIKKLIVDAISSFLADPFDMQSLNPYMVIIGSQKAIALPPGISVLLLSPTAVNDINNGEGVKSLYLDIKRHLKDMERGQTPFTPAVSVLIMMNKRLHQIFFEGVNNTLEDVSKLAKYFRKQLKKEDLPFVIASETPSNALTPIMLTSEARMTATELFETLKNRFNIYICPNGVELKEKLFRVGHIGNMTNKDIDTLFDALYKLKEEGRL